MSDHDEVLQMQLEHTGDQLRKATQARVIIITASKDDEIQTAMHMDGYNTAHEKAELMGEAIRAMICTAATALQEQTNGSCKLLVMTPKGVAEALPKEIDAAMIERRKP